VGLGREGNGIYGEISYAQSNQPYFNPSPQGLILATFGMSHKISLIFTNIFPKPNQLP
jgi:hypothetical protein